MNNRKGLFLGETKILSELCDSITDCHHSTPKWTDKGKLVIRNFNIKKGRLSLSDPSFTNDETFNERIKRKKPESGDLIITREAPMGEVCIIPEDLECCLGQRMVLLKPNKKRVVGSYLLYALQSEFVQTQIRKSDKTGSIVSNLRIPVLEQLNIPVFDTITQEKIGSILKNIDSKIEINNSINTELEAMAKTIYDYWFVQFDFPDKHGKPYKTSGGKMIWNDELMREIPEGWESLQLASKLLFEKGIEPGSAEYTDKKESIYHVNFIRVGDVDGSSAIFIDTRQKKYSMVSERDVLVTFDGSVGKVAFGLAGAYSGGLRKIFDKFGLIDNSLIYFVFKDERINRTIHKYATGSILLHAGGSINVLKIPYNEEKYLEYQNIILSSYNKMVMNKKENQKLTELRDWLLPMLMNGQVKVS